MTLVIGIECSDGIVVGADSKGSVKSPSGKNLSTVPLQKIIELKPHNKLYGFSCNNTVGLDKIELCLIGYLNEKKNFHKLHFILKFLSH